MSLPVHDLVGSSYDQGLQHGRELRDPSRRSDYDRNAASCVERAPAPAERASPLVELKGR